MENGPGMKMYFLLKNGGYSSDRYVSLPEGNFIHFTSHGMLMLMATQAASGMTFVGSGVTGTNGSCGSHKKALGGANRFNEEGGSCNSHQWLKSDESWANKYFATWRP